MDSSIYSKTIQRDHQFSKNIIYIYMPACINKKQVSTKGIFESCMTPLAKNKSVELKTKGKFFLKAQG